MTGYKYITILLLSLMFSVPKFMEVEYQHGMEAYKHGKFETAIDAFEKVLSNQWESPQHLYNLGNAYYRSDNIYAAVWSYEQCLRIDPTHENAEFNLRMANVKVKDRIDVPPAPFYLKFYWSLREKFTPSEWITFSLTLLLLISFLMMIRKFYSWTNLKLFEDLLLIMMSIVMLISIHSIWTQESTDLGIIYSDTIEVYSEPNPYSTQLFTVHGGLKVSISNRSGAWTEIQLIDGKSGWIPMTEIRILH